MTSEQVRVPKRRTNSGSPDVDAAECCHQGSSVGPNPVAGAPVVELPVETDDVDAFVEGQPAATPVAGARQQPGVVDDDAGATDGSGAAGEAPGVKRHNPIGIHRLQRSERLVAGGEGLPDPSPVGGVVVGPAGHTDHDPEAGLLGHPSYQFGHQIHFVGLRRSGRMGGAGELR